MRGGDPDRDPVSPSRAAFHRARHVRLRPGGRRCGRSAVPASRHLLRQARHRHRAVGGGRPSRRPPHPPRSSGREGANEKLPEPWTDRPGRLPGRGGAVDGVGRHQRLDGRVARLVVPARRPPPHRRRRQRLGRAILLEEAPEEAPAAATPLPQGLTPEILRALADLEERRDGSISEGEYQRRAPRPAARRGGPLSGPGPCFRASRRRLASTTRRSPLRITCPVLSTTHQFLPGRARPEPP